LPGAAYTEKDGLYVNLEGRVQSAFKASFPPGEAKEDWKILRALSEALGKPLKFNTLDQLRNKMFESYPQLSTIDQLPRNDLNKLSISNTLDILDSKVIFNSIDYYQSNEIARSSKTMLNCKLSKNELSKTGTEN
jgi:NADH-quinone oxidoreductase subunit G